MHELSIAHNVVELALEGANDAGIHPVDAVYVRLGVLSGVVKEALEFSFDVAAAGTPLEGARLVIEEVPVKVFCRECRQESTLDKPFPLRCPHCGSRTRDVLAGRELELYALEGGDGKHGPDD